MGLISPYILAIVAAWVMAHLIKYIIALKKGTVKDVVDQIFISGGMPSAHAATSVALWTIIMLKDGIESGLFGIASLFVLIIAYDAMKVRRSSGEQGDAIAQLIKESGSKIRLPRAAKGHSPLEVLIGAVLGLGVGYIVFFALS
jgi:acid phosphatase family membrane protein YuiD